jgi:DNA adenine methylase
VQPRLPFLDAIAPQPRPFRAQFLKWIGNKQRFAAEIVSLFPKRFGTYIEPFLGSAAVMATLSPTKAVGSDVFKPLIEIWRTLQLDPDIPCQWYRDRWEQCRRLGKEAAYERIKADYNKSPNGPDLLFLCRSCYGGVVRFRKADGFMSTPCGPHQPIPPESFERRAKEWRRRLRHVEFVHADYQRSMTSAEKGDLIYCDPPYSDSQGILYGAQSFSLRRLLEVIQECKERGVNVALSIDGTKRSGSKICDIPIPKNLFKTEVAINCGRSMLRRFQMRGESLEKEVVADRLLLTYLPDRS